MKITGCLRKTNHAPFEGFDRMSITDEIETDNPYYRRLNRLRIWPVALGVGSVAAIVVGEMAVLYWIYLPDLLSPLEQRVSPEIKDFLFLGIHKLIMGLTVWTVVSLLLNLLLVYVTWNVKKLFESVG